jgi:hypothetical protein
MPHRALTLQRRRPQARRQNRQIFPKKISSPVDFLEALASTRRRSEIF